MRIRCSCQCRTVVSFRTDRTDGSRRRSSSQKENGSLEDFFQRVTIYRLIILEGGRGEPWKKETITIIRVSKREKTRNKECVTLESYTRLTWFLFGIIFISNNEIILGIILINDLIIYIFGNRRFRNGASIKHAPIYIYTCCRFSKDPGNRYGTKFKKDYMYLSLIKFVDGSSKNWVKIK